MNRTNPPYFEVMPTRPTDVSTRKVYTWRQASAYARAANFDAQIWHIDNKKCVATLVAKWIWATQRLEIVRGALTGD